MYKNQVRGLEIEEITPGAKEMIAHYRRCGGIVFDGEMIGLLWTDRSDGRAGSKTAGIRRGIDMVSGASWVGNRLSF